MNEDKPARPRKTSSRATVRRTSNRDVTQRQQAEEALQERMRHSQSLLRLSRQLERAQTSHDIVAAARAEVQAIIGYQNLWVYLLTEDQQYYDALAAEGQISESVMTGEGIARLTIAGDPMLEEIARATQIVIIEDARLDERTDKAIVARLGNRTIVNVPIILFDKHLGAIGTGTFGAEGVRVPTLSEQEYLMAMASHIAVSLDRLHLSGQRRQAEEALRESEQKFRSFVQESSEGFTLVDEQGRIIEWNHAREKMTGLATNQALGRLVWDVQHEMLPPELRTPERHARTRQLVQDALRTGQSSLFNDAIEAEVMTQAGERRFVQQTIFPIKTDLGYRIGSVTSDITERRRADETLRQSEELLRVTLTNILDPVFITDDDGKLTFICPNVAGTLGYSVEEMQAMGNISQLLGDGLFDPEELELRGEIFNLERLIVDNFGRQRVFLATVKRVSIGEGTRLYALHDITDRKQAEETLHRLNRELRAISDCNQSLMRAVDEQTLLNDICRIVCDEAGYRMAWVGYAEHDDAKTIRAAAWAGSEDGYLANANLTWADTERGRGPTGTAIRTGESVCIQDFAADLQAAPWREDALRRGYRSSIALPLKDGNANAFGVLCIDSTEPNAFTPDEMRLLEELAGDLAFGIMVLRDRAERKRTQEALTLFRKLIDHTNDAIEVIDPETGHFLDANEQAYHALGYTREELLSLSVPEINPLVAERSWKETIKELRRAGFLVRESQRQRKDGLVFPVEINISYTRLDRDYVLAVVRDITERKQAEQALRESEERLRQIASSLREVVWLRDVQTRQVLYVNSAFQELTGRTCESFYENRDIMMDTVHPDDKEWVIKALDQRSESVPFDKEHRIIHLDGSVRWVWSRIFPVRNEAGEVYRWASIMEDITERKRTEAALRESQALYRSFIEQLPNPIFRKDSENRYVMVNSSFCRLKGLGAADFLGRKPAEIAASESARQGASGQAVKYAAQGEAAHELIMRTGQIIETEEEHPGADGGTLWTHVIRMPVFDPDGKVIGTQGIQFDITERKRADEALRESEERYRYLIENLYEVIFTLDTQGNLNYISPAIQRVSAYAPEETIGQHFGRFIHPDDLPELQASLVRVLAGQHESTEFRIITKDGGLRWVQTSSRQQYRQGRLVGIMGVLVDTTERKQAEARILRLNRLYATLSQINQTIVHVRDRAPLFEQICRVAVDHGQFRLAWIGLTDEVTGQIVPVVFAGEEQGYLANLQITVRDERQGRGPTGTAIREGRCIICQDIATDPGMQPWRDAALQRGYRSTAAVPIRQNARVVGALTVYAAEPHSLDTEDEYLLDEIGLDISFALDGLEQETQRQHAETELSRLNAELEQRVIERTAELERAHERLRAILDTAGEGVVFTDPQGTIEYINPAMERLTGYTADEVLGRNPRLWKSAHTPLSTYQHMWRALLRGEIWQGELINRRRDGALYDAALTTSPVTDLDGRIVGYVGVQRDITRQKELDRLKDQFVSNVSHELRTPIANVMLHLGLLIRGRPERHDIYLRTLQREADRLRRMIEDLLDLSRLDRNVTPIQLTPTDIHQLLESLVVDRAALAAQRGLTLKYEPAPGLPLALSDASKLMQVISNLLTNALNYTPAGGQVTVLSAVHRTTTQQWIAIIVRDTGPGIADNDLAHLFERFYRGEAGRNADAPGTGLGLAISHEIMERLGGRITVESEPGQGAAFTVWVKADNDGVTR